MKTSPSDMKQATFPLNDDYRDLKDLVSLVVELSCVVASLSWGHHPMHDQSHRVYCQAMELRDRMVSVTDNNGGSQADCGLAPDPGLWSGW